jgi:hypothetical integral membrane protein (TIGR02206 family)
MVGAATACVWFARRHPGRPVAWLCRGLALVIFVAWVGEYVADGVLGTWTIEYGLPLQLTDAVSAASILALLARRALLVELCYLWSFTASLQAVLTPDLGQAFPSVYYFTYFTYHIGAIVAASLLVFGCRQYPQAGAVRRVYLATLAWTALAGVGDLITGGNYMYLRDKPAHASLLRFLGPWPWYIATSKRAFNSTSTATCLPFWLASRRASTRGELRPTRYSVILIASTSGSSADARRKSITGWKDSKGWCSRISPS